MTFCVLGQCMCLMHFSSKKGSLRVSIGEPSFYVGGFLLALIFLFFLLKFFYFPLLIPLFKFVRSSYNYDYPPLLPHVCSFFLVLLTLPLYSFLFYISYPITDNHSNLAEFFTLISLASSCNTSFFLYSTFLPCLCCCGYG